MGSGKCLHDGETDFVDSVGEVIDFVGVVVVEDYSECTGCDTEGGVDKSLRRYRVESSVESGAPDCDRAWKDLIIPITVPRRPTRVPRVVMVAMMGRFCWR